jgi:hypothetical protein
MVSEREFYRNVIDFSHRASISGLVEYSELSGKETACCERRMEQILRDPFLCEFIGTDFERPNINLVEVVSYLGF